MKGRCAVSIDLDDLACYYRIHGLGEPPPELAAVILECALPRAAAWLATRGLVATWFVVGRDLDASADASSASVGGVGATAAATLLGLHRAGHELGNHSMSHPYQLSRLSEAQLEAEIDGCDRVLRRLTGEPVMGFRAPGYDVSSRLVAALEARRYRYDSSIFPAPAYYLAKAAVMGALAVLGQPSGAVLTDPRALTAPRAPYRLDASAPWQRGQSALVELPISVTPHLRLPLIGTSLLLAPPRLRARLLSAILDEPVFNFELHVIDFIDAERDGIPGELVARQPDLRLPVAVKLARLDAILDTLGPRFGFTTLAEIAGAAQREQ
jgi:peptidoglycan-N-acetylglucosamine deacetylase